jgi:hypothetical protein
MGLSVVNRLLFLLLSVLGEFMPYTAVSDDPVDATTSTHIVSEVALETHCGIFSLHHDNEYVRQGGRLHDGQNNPPDDWPNGTAFGELRIGDNSVIFTDADGHREVFLRVEKPGLLFERCV